MRAARVRLLVVSYADGSGVSGSHLPVVVGAADRLAQGAVAARRLAELLRELAEQALAREVAARLGDLVAEHLGEAEVLEQRDDVGERLVEGERVAVASAAGTSGSVASSSACVVSCATMSCERQVNTRPPGSCAPVAGPTAGK